MPGFCGPICRSGSQSRLWGAGCLCYLHNPNQDRAGSTGAGSTHAWAEVYVTGAGWITFDPTNHSVGGFNLIPVAVARDIRQAMPVSGNFIGLTDAFLGMGVEVSVTS
jgi:transglutaminase-like putative cysteine protease